MKVTACPPECTVDWIKMHRDLDIATAHMIAEASLDTPVDEYLPSKMTLMKFLEYTYAKSNFQKDAEVAKT